VQKFEKVLVTSLLMHQGNYTAAELVT